MEPHTMEEAQINCKSVNLTCSRSNEGVKYIDCYYKPQSNVALVLTNINSVFLET